MGLNVRKKRAYEDLNYNWLVKSLDISAISLHRIVHHVFQSDVVAIGRLDVRWY